MKKIFFYATAGITMVMMALVLIWILYLTCKPLENPFAYHSIGIMVAVGVAVLTCGLAAFLLRCIEDAKEKKE